jgi:hypothetical protein
MKTIKYIALTAVLSISAICAVFYVSCTKDSCKTVTCLNGGNCGGGSCICQKGVGGQGCEIVYRKLYSNVYKGTGSNDSLKQYPDNLFTFTIGPDTNYTKMELSWNNYGPVFINMPIVLTNNSSSGSTFTIAQTIVGTTFYTGSGVVNSTSASVTLKETKTIPDTVTRTITFTSLVKQ